MLYIKSKFVSQLPLQCIPGITGKKTPERGEKIMREKKKNERGNISLDYMRTLLPHPGIVSYVNAKKKEKLGRKTTTGCQNKAHTEKKLAREK